MKIEDMGDNSCKELNQQHIIIAVESVDPTNKFSVSCIHWQCMWGGIISIVWLPWNLSHCLCESHPADLFMIYEMNNDALSVYCTIWYASMKF